MGMRLLVLVPCLAAPLAGQVGPTERVLCDPGVPGAACPDTPCICTDDTLEVVFDEVGASVLEIDAPSPGLSVPMSVLLEARSSLIQGWSYGVAHERERIQLESVTLEGTDAFFLLRNGFQVTTLQDVFFCRPPAPACIDEEPGGGYIAACVLSLTENVVLPPGRSSISKASYRLIDGSAEEPIQITLSERLKRKGSPPVAINLTIDGRSVQPRIVADGWIIWAERQGPFHRGDPDADGRVSVLDSVSLFLFLFLSGPAPACLEAGDFDDDGRVDGTDPILILRWLFLHGSSPASPGPPGLECGADPEGSPSQLGCAAYLPC